MTQTTEERARPMFTKWGPEEAAFAAELDTLRAELTEALAENIAFRDELNAARAFISTIIDAPKDYPAEEGM